MWSGRSSKPKCPSPWKCAKSTSCCSIIEGPSRFDVAQCSKMQYCAMSTHCDSVKFNTMRYGAILYNTTQCFKIQQNTCKEAQSSTVEHSAISLEPLLIDHLQYLYTILIFEFKSFGAVSYQCFRFTYSTHIEPTLLVPYHPTTCSTLLLSSSP